MVVEHLPIFKALLDRKYFLPERDSKLSLQLQHWTQYHLAGHPSSRQLYKPDVVLFDAF